MSSHGRVLFRWICLQVIFASVLSEDWQANVVTKIKALTTSCVVLPCTFKYPGAQLPDSRLRAIWHTKEKQDQIIYHEDRTRVIDNFKDRTTLLGRLSEKNCTLEIDKVRDHDNGPFCFRAEIPQKDQYSFLKNCVTIKPTDEPENLQLDKKEFLEEGEPVSFRCSVKHTCPSHPPTITWSYPNSNPTVNHRDISDGNWEAESLLTLIPKEKDAHTFLTCTIKFHGEKTRTITTPLYVKRKENYLHIIIPVAAALGTALLFGVMCFFMSKKYKSQIQELQSGNGFLGRMSRMSQRFRSRRMNEPDLNMGKPNNSVSTMSGTTGCSKPYIPTKQ